MITANGKLPREWDESDLQYLIDTQTQESLELEYKACDSLDFKDSKHGSSHRSEVSKDVAAFANSAGGVIVYGIREDTQKHFPSKLDSGYDPDPRSKDTTHVIMGKEQLEQIINQDVHPKIDGMRIKEVQLRGSSNGKVLFVVEIPQATNFDPHMAANHTYPKRHNFQSIAMEDYEVRDALNRKNGPLLNCSFELKFNSEQQLYEFQAYLENQSAETAFYLTIRILIDKRIEVVPNSPVGFSPGMNQFALNDNGLDIEMSDFERNWSIPGMIPIYKGIKVPFSHEPISIRLPSVQGETYHIASMLDSPNMRRRMHHVRIHTSGGKAVLGPVELIEPKT